MIDSGHVDLLGDPIKAKKFGIGYAAPPGTGPEDENCGTCRHSFRQHGGSRSYWKCGHEAGSVSHGEATDIRVGSPACRHWEKWDMKDQNV